MSQLNITSIKNKRGDFGPNLVGYSTVTGDLNVTGNLKVGGGVTVSGITTFSGDISFDSDVSIGGTLTASDITANDVSIGGTLGVDGDVSIGNSIKLYPSTGIVTAVYFYGDGSNLENLPASAGLGTVLSEDETSPLNKIYYTDQVLAIGSTVTVNPPDSAQVAYTQYAQIVLNNDADLIVAPGDDFIPDILGIGTTGVGSGALTGDGGRVRADNLTNRAGTGAPNASNGLIVTGIATATTFDGNVTGNVTGTASNASGATGDFSIADKIVHTGDTDTAIRFPAVDTFTVETGGSERVRIDSSGNVAIGPAAADGLLHVKGSNPNIYIETANANEQSDIIFQSHVGGDQGSVSYSLLDNSLRFATNGTSNERMRIGSSGQLGLGGANYGTSGQVITSNGSGSAPTWQDGGGAWNLVATITASNASSATFQGDLDSTYKQYVAVLSEITSDGALNSELRMNFMVGATDLTGSLYDTTASRTTVNSSTAFTINQNDAAYGRISNSGMDSDNPNHFVSAVVWLSGGRNAQSHAARFESINPVTATLGTQLTGMIQYQDTSNQAVDGIKFFPSSDTFSGTFKLYGLS